MQNFISRIGQGGGGGGGETEHTWDSTEKKVGKIFYDNAWHNVYEKSYTKSGRIEAGTSDLMDLGFSLDRVINIDYIFRNSSGTGFSMYSLNDDNSNNIYIDKSRNKIVAQMRVAWSNPLLFITLTYTKL